MREAQFESGLLLLTLTVLGAALEQKSAELFDRRVGESERADFTTRAIVLVTQFQSRTEAGIVVLI